MLEVSLENKSVASMLCKLNALSVAAQSYWPSWSPWVASWKGYLLGTLYFSWGTSALTLATMEKPGGGNWEEWPAQVMLCYWTSVLVVEWP